MKEIQLSQNKVALVDDEDFEWLSEHKWYAKKIRCGELFYAYRSVFINKKKTTLVMHREILRMDLKKKYGVDFYDTTLHVNHRNTEGLDNRKGNLRSATASEIACTRPKTYGRLKYKGVYFDGSRNRYCAVVKLKKKVVYQKRSFRTEEDAALAYNIAALKHHGEFANLNVVPQLQ